MPRLRRTDAPRPGAPGRVLVAGRPWWRCWRSPPLVRADGRRGVTDGRGRGVMGTSVGAVQSLYVQDLLARVNAERAARNSAGQPVPR